MRNTKLLRLVSICHHWPTNRTNIMMENTIRDALKELLHNIHKNDERKNELYFWSIAICNGVLYPLLFYMICSQKHKSIYDLYLYFRTQCPMCTSHFISVWITLKWSAVTSTSNQIHFSKQNKTENETDEKRKGISAK